MTELYEFRVREKYASRIFEPGEGIRLSLGKKGRKLPKAFEELGVRQIEISPTDSRFSDIGTLNASLKACGDWFFAGWNVRRLYTTEELSNAELFLLCKITTFEPAGEQRGTKYDESKACIQCGAGATQISPLFLDWKRLPKGKDIARTIAGEVVVSRRTTKIFQDYSITGVEFRPLRHSPASSAESKDWFQLTVTSSDTEVVPPTRTGVDPFDNDVPSQYRCPAGHLIGLARLSEAWVSRSSYAGFDAVASRQFLGARRGLLRPERLLLISPRLRRLIAEQQLKGFDFEVAYLK